MVSIVTNVIIIVNVGTRIVAGYSYYLLMTIGDFVSKSVMDAVIEMERNSKNSVN